MNLIKNLNHYFFISIKEIMKIETSLSNKMTDFIFYEDILRN